MNKETGEYGYYAPGYNSSFFKEPKRVDRPSDWGDINISQEVLVQYVLHNREKWVSIENNSLCINNK